MAKGQLDHNPISDLHLGSLGSDWSFNLALVEEGSSYQSLEGASCNYSRMLDY
jgi:hypothetical protein